MSPVADLDFITIIAQKKDESKIIDAAVKAGAPGATVLYGKGTGVRQKMGFQGRFVDAEKAVILLGVSPTLTSSLIRAVNLAANLNNPANGLICIQKAQQVIGFL